MLEGVLMEVWIKVGEDLEPMPCHPLHADLSKGDAHFWWGFLNRELGVSLGQPLDKVVACEGRKIDVL